MKTLFDRLQELKNEAISNIINGDYELINACVDGSNHYTIHINVGGCIFEMSIPTNLKYLVYHNCDFNLDGSEREIANILYKKHIQLIEKMAIEEKIKELQSKL